MSKFLYLTVDQIGLPTGGGAVTFHESTALKELGPTDVIDRQVMKDPVGDEPWKWDQMLSRSPGVLGAGGGIKLAHGYAGTFTETVKRLKDNGCKVTWTCAAHDVDKSRAEHDKLGIPFPYDHLNIPEQFERYIGGYKLADVLITPSKHSYDVLRRQGCTNDLRIVPHGCSIPICTACGGEEQYCDHCISTGYEPPKPLPKRYTVGYLGAIGSDKGLIYLIQAWAILKYKDALLVIAGRDSTHPAVRYLLQQAGAGNVHLAGWQESVSDFYSQCSVYIQPSVTEGFGIEVLEAQAHGRPVICSDGAGAADMITGTDGVIVPAANVDALVSTIDYYKTREQRVDRAGWANAQNHSWAVIRERYKEIWKDLLK